jgi:4-amino-4-deoxy-L-arabinose transferase-like glycosyltransferase
VAPLAFVLALAFAARLGWTLVAAQSPSEGAYTDQIFYHMTAHQLLAGNGYTRIDGTPTAVWPPLYPVFLSGLYALTDGSLETGRVANAVLGALTTFLTYAIGKRLFGRRAGLVAAGLFALCPDDVFFSNFVMSEVLFGALFTGVVWLYTVLDQRRPAASAWAWAALGAGVGLASLTRGVAILWLAVPLAIHWLGARSLRSAAQHGACATAGLVLALMPWTVRNQVMLGEPVLIATSLGRTLGHAHSPYQEAGASVKGLLYWREIADRYAGLPQPERELTTNRVLTRMALEYMVTHPGHELGLVPLHLVELYHSGHVGLELGRKQLEDGSIEPVFDTRTHALLAGSADAYLYGLLALGILGLPRCFRRDARTALVVPLTIAYFTLLHVTFFPDDPRYHLPVLPFLAISAGALIASRRAPFVLAAASAVACVSAAPDPARVEPSGYHGVRIGMTAAQAEAAYGAPLEPLAPKESSCTLLYPGGQPGPVRFLVNEGSVARIDVTAPGILTREKVGVESLESEVEAAYPGKLTVSPHKYTWEQGDHYLTVVAPDGHRLVFETDGKRVTLYRAGRMPEVEWVEGCL